MSNRSLVALDAGPGSVAVWTEALRAALDGSGPALLPLPSGPPAVRQQLTTMLRPGDPSTPLESEGIALVVPTSGSTGAPKGALLTADALRASAAATHTRLGGTGHWVLALPLAHVAGLMVAIRALAVGLAPWEVGAADGFDPERFVETTVRAATHSAADGLPLYTSLVPTQLARLLDASPAAVTALESYAAILLGGAATPASLLERARAAGARVVTTYGMTETCGGCVYDGRPLDGVGIGVDATGRVLIDGPTLFAGYRLRPDLTAKALDGRGRLVTADLGELGPDGRLRLLGRADDVIVTGGENVAPALVEDALATVLGVGATVVVGVADPQWGQRVVALVVARAGESVRGSDLRAALGRLLPPPAVPRDVYVVDSLPLLASGKPDRGAAQAIAARQRPDPRPGDPGR